MGKNESRDERPSTKGPRPEGPRTQGTQCLLADGQEPAVIAPADAAPAEDQAAPVAVPAQAGHVAVAARVHPDGAELHHRELPLDIRVLRPERQELGDGGRPEAETVEVSEHLFGARRLVQVDEHCLNLGLVGSRDREVFRRDVGILPGNFIPILCKIRKK